MRRIIDTRILAALNAMGAVVLNSSSALKSQGTTFGVGDAASPEVFTTIADVVTIEGPSLSAEAIPVTDLSSARAQYIDGLPDEGEVTLELNFIPGNTQHAALRTDLNAGTSKNYRITFTDSPATTWTFPALVTAAPSPSSAVNDKLTGSVTLRLTGATALVEA